MQGRLHEVLVRRDGDPEPWLQLNRVAHGTPDDLRDLARPRSRRARSDGAAVRLGRHLATLLLTRAAHGVDLPTLQRRLWPLEAELIESSSALTRDVHVVAFLALAALDTD